MKEKGIYFDGLNSLRFFDAMLKKMFFQAPLILLFLGFALNKDQENRFVNWIKSNSIINYLGKISFGLYMYHTVIAEQVHALLKVANSGLLNAVVTITLTILISAISFELFEKRIVSLKRYIY